MPMVPGRGDERVGAGGDLGGFAWRASAGAQRLPVRPVLGAGSAEDAIQHVVAITIRQVSAAPGSSAHSRWLRSVHRRQCIDIGRTGWTYQVPEDM